MALLGEPFCRLFSEVELFFPEHDHALRKKESQNGSLGE